LTLTLPPSWEGGGSERQSENKIKTMEVKIMTNNAIIFEAVKASFTTEELAALANATHTPEEINRLPLDVLVADDFHTFAEWKNLGFCVAKGEHAMLICWLWKYTDKPKKDTRTAEETASDDAPEAADPHFYKAKSHLFHLSQVHALEDHSAA
jgi:hypothetical protein